ncbi:MAG TPA: hypothetical protein VK395_23065, partial [Gemmataceae bacterium]|nr:hypothetical protein [Gemmataceae bacterium]
LRDRLPMIIKIREENLPLVRSNVADRAKDRDGSSSHGLALHLRFLGSADYVLHADVNTFKAHLTEAATIILGLLKRYDRGESIDASLVTMLTYKDLFDALAAGDMELARSLAQHMGGRDELEKKHDHPFDRALGYTLRAFVLNQPQEMTKCAADFSIICKEADNADFQGYAHVFNAILTKNVAMANEGLQQILQGHKHQSKRGGVFKDTVDEILCVWGVGIANLARSDDLFVQGLPPLIPPDLLIPSLPSGSIGAR